MGVSVSVGVGVGVWITSYIYSLGGGACEVLVHIYYLLATLYIK